MTTLTLTNPLLANLNLEDIPEGTTKIILCGCTGLVNLPETLPAGLTSLDLSYCTGLENLPETLPAGLTSLDLHGCTDLVNLPETLPAELIDLDLSDCTGLENLPETLPAGLAGLYLHGCTGLVNLPETLPAGLVGLYLHDCTSLVRLPAELPAGLTRLDLSGCTGLLYSLELVAKLTELEQRNAGNPAFQLIWPAHIERTPAIAAVKEILTTAYRSYHQPNEDLRERVPDPADSVNYPTLSLLHRFMTESVVERGGLDRVVGFVLPIVEQLAANPQLLEFVDESAKVHLEACVNQPVAGFTEIANLVNIASQPDIPSKLEAARVLMAINAIREEVLKLGVGPGVQVELANAMLREVHHSLLSAGVIARPWPGVPEGIAYQGTVQSFLTAHNVGRISNLVADELRSPLAKVGEYLCEGHQQDFWARMTLSKEEMQAFNAPLMEKRKEFLELEDGDEEGETRLLSEVNAAETSFRESILSLSRTKTHAVIKEAKEAAGVVTGATGAALQGDKCCTIM